MGKPTVGTAQAAVVIVEPARNTVPLMFPITRVRHRLELELGIVQQRGLFIIRVDVVVLAVALVHEGVRLSKRVFRLGRVGILLQDCFEVCVSYAVVSLSRRDLFAHFLRQAGRARK
jgi:hypothetical protein